MRKTPILAFLFLAGAVTGTAVAAVDEDANTLDLGVGDQVKEDAVDLDLGIPALAGDSSQSFIPNVAASSSRSVVSFDNGSTLTFVPSSDEVCYEFNLADSTFANICDNLETIATGLAHSAFYNGHTDELEVFGIVPDGVSSVVVSGQKVAVQSNVWHVLTTPGSKLEIEVVGPKGISNRLADS